MERVAITPEMTLFDITEKYPATIPVFVANGFAHVGDPAKRTSHGRMVTLAQAVRMKNKDLETFCGLLESAVEGEHQDQDVTLQAAEEPSSLFPSVGDVRVAGLLPCPVRIPLLESFAAVQKDWTARTGLTVGCRLAAASVGADALAKEMEKIAVADDLPHIFVSAGFEAFFDRKNLRRFKDQDVFVDHSWAEMNPLFADYDLQDPDRHFTMLGVVPAVFLVDKSQVSRESDIPRTWADLLTASWRKKVALPVGDFDLFNGILLTIWKEFGDEGVRNLAQNLLTSLHPSQTTGRFAPGQGKGPAVSVIPYFFSKMAKFNPLAELVWPTDGAIISPIFLLQRQQAPAAAREIADFFCSQEVGEILAHKGLFPSCHPVVQNRVPAGARFQWLGWDFIREHDLGELIPRLNRLFEEDGLHS